MNTKKSINNKKLFLIGLGLLIFGRILYYVIGGMTATSITVVLDFIAYPIMIIAIIRYFIGLFRTKKEEAK